MYRVKAREVIGFTLVEVLVFMSVIAIMGSLVAPNYVSTQRKNCDDNAIYKAMTLEMAMVAYLQDQGAQAKAKWKDCGDNDEIKYLLLKPYLNHQESNLGADGKMSGTYVPEGYNFKLPDITGDLGGVIVTVHRNLDGGLLRGADAIGSGNALVTAAEGASSGASAQTYHLSLEVRENGQPTTNVVGVAVGADTYGAGTSANIAAVSKNGYVFEGWENEDGSTVGVTDPASANTTVLMNKDKTLWANFRAPASTPANYRLTIQIRRNGQPAANPDAVGKATGDGLYEKGKYATAAAAAVDNHPSMPGPDYIFVGWTNPDGSTTDILNPASGDNAKVRMDEDRTICANFLGVYRLILEVAVDGRSPSLLNPPIMPSSVGTAIAPSLGAFPVEGYYGDIVEGNAPIGIVAMSMTGYTFVEWQTPGLGIASAQASSTTVDMVNLAGGEAKIVVASFAKENYALTFQTTLNGQPVPEGLTVGTASSPDSQFPNYHYGNTANVTATPSTNYVFNGWKNLDSTTTDIDDPSSTNTLVLMNAAKTLVADFKEENYALTFQTTLNGQPVVPEGLTVGTASSPDSQFPNYHYGNTANVTATPSTNYVFNGWKNLDSTTTDIDDPSSTNTLVLMNAAKTLVADFKEDNRGKHDITVCVVDRVNSPYKTLHSPFSSGPWESHYLEYYPKVPSPLTALRKDWNVRVTKNGVALPITRDGLTKFKAKASDVLEFRAKRMHEIDNIVNGKYMSCSYREYVILAKVIDADEFAGYDQWYDESGDLDSSVQAYSLLGPVGPGWSDYLCKGWNRWCYEVYTMTGIHSKNILNYDSLSPYANNFSEPNFVDACLTRDDSDQIIRLSNLKKDADIVFVIGTLYSPSTNDPTKRPYGVIPDSIMYSENKKCPYCESNMVVKDAVYGGTQLYRCQECGELLVPCFFPGRFGGSRGCNQIMLKDGAPYKCSSGWVQKYTCPHCGWLNKFIPVEMLKNTGG